MGWASGLQAGIRLGETIRQGQLENALAEEAKKYRVTEGSPEQDTFNSAIDAAIRQKTGLSAGGEAPVPVDTETGLQSAARAARDVTPQYSFGGQYYANPREAEAAASQARTQGLADVYRSQGYIDKASELESRAQQQQAAALQIRQGLRAEKKDLDFDQGYAELNKQTFDTPQAKTDALIALVEKHQGPVVAQQLRANHSTTELNNIRVNAERFENEYKQARLKGADAVLSWFDKANDTYKLERDPKNPYKVYQVNTDGSRSVFADAKNEQEFWMTLDARAKPEGWLALSKHQLDVKNAQSMSAYRDAMIQSINDGKNAITNVQLGMSRDENGKLIQVMSGLRLNSRTGTAETVQIPLKNNVIPMTALDPKAIDKEAESLIGTPIDPTNKKGPVHTEQSAKQAVLDSIVNQYLGPKQEAGAPDLSPQGLAASIVNSANRETKPDTRQSTSVRNRPASQSMGIDTGRARADINAITGLPREIATPSGPNFVAAAQQGLTAAQQNYVAYLQDKIDRGEPLTRDEAFRAQRFGLMK